MLVATPPSARPANSSTGRAPPVVVSSADTPYSAQKARHARLRPHRSASAPTNTPPAAPDTNPVVNSADTVDAGSPYSSRYRL